jgi:hypothetical protein
MMERKIIKLMGRYAAVLRTVRHIANLKSDVHIATPVEKIITKSMEDCNGSKSRNQRVR